jgi:hypothetical protein
MPNLIINGFFGPILKGDENRIGWGPMVKIEIADPLWDSASKVLPKIVATDVTALIDTGAANCFINNELAQSLRLPILRSGVAAGLEGKTNTHSYKLTIVNSGIGKITELSEIVGRDLSEAAFTVVLGWSFLSRYTLSISKKTDTVKLE